MDLDPALAALRPLGGFFALHTPPGGSVEPSGPLPTLAQAYAEPLETPQNPETPDSATSDVYRDPLTFRVRKVTRALRAPEGRIGASVAQQGLAARLWSVTLGCAVLYGSVPDLAPGLLRWDPDAGAPDDLWLTEVRARPGDAATVAATVLDGHLEPLSAALRARHPVAPGLLRGNAGSALAGTARQLGQWARAHGRPDVAARARALTAELFTHPLLADTGTLTGTAFRRRSCCLYYRVPGGGLCGDCCFTRPPRSSPRAPSG
ncbi:(2Fe-2S)-binding protein [Streptomyces sp. NBC_01485]|uniref:(2Fe-2S)-binding protein n=1 Tax=Streptomyces sp. NBC_01485 TaxID=2903884 RepID=UPI002E3566CF|nr:(2Fe-2S)-binding protein [Streptomyces sp. NBC_01485]